MEHRESIEAVRAHFDDLGDKEWERLTTTVAGRVSLEIHSRFLRRFVRPGWRVLEVGAGPGRFTFALATLGARIVVTDVSGVQLELNEARLRDTEAEQRVERRELLDVCDTARYEEAEFDAVVAFGGPLSYAFERAEEAMRGLLRIVRPQGVVVASVMSWLGAWRHFLPAITAHAEAVGEDANDEVLRTGDLRHLAADPSVHIWPDVSLERSRSAGGAGWRSYPRRKREQLGVARRPGAAGPTRGPTAGAGLASSNTKWPPANSPASATAAPTSSSPPSARAQVRSGELGRFS